MGAFAFGTAGLIAFISKEPMLSAYLLSTSIVSLLGTAGLLIKFRDSQNKTEAKMRVRNEELDETKDNNNKKYSINVDDFDRNSEVFKLLKVNKATQTKDVIELNVSIIKGANKGKTIFMKIDRNDGRIRRVELIK